MKTAIACGCLVCAVWLVGCNKDRATPSYKPVDVVPIDVVVYDAETSQPLAGAVVVVGYPNGPAFSREARVTTDPMGRAKMDVRTIPGFFELYADGYMEGRTWENPGKNGRPKDPVKFYLYKPPSPQITVVVPNGYRGPLKIDVQPVNARVQGEPGKRQFTFEASSTGYVRIDATPLLFEHVGWGDWGCHFIHFTDKNGTLFPYGDHGVPKRDYEAGPNEIALRTVGALGHRFLLVLGTESDAKPLCHLTWKHDVNGVGVDINPKAFNALFDQSR